MKGGLAVLVLGSTRRSAVLYLHSFAALSGSFQAVPVCVLSLVFYISGKSRMGKWKWKGGLEGMEGMYIIPSLVVAMKRQRDLLAWFGSGRDGKEGRGLGR